LLLRTLQLGQQRNAAGRLLLEAGVADARHEILHFLEGNDATFVGIRPSP
jgi:hypothetical protein